MEYKTETNSPADCSQNKKKNAFNGNKYRQVYSKLADDKRKKRSVTKIHLKINSSISDSANIVPSKLDCFHPSNDDNFQLNCNSEDHLNFIIDKLNSTCLNTSPSKITKLNSFPKIGLATVNTEMDSNKNPFKKEILYSSSKKINKENVLKQKNILQFVTCEDSSNALCRFCHCIICNDTETLTEHATSCKTFNETKLNYIHKFSCLICDKILKSFKDWKSHTIDSCHINKCLYKYDNVSYDCGGCKTMFFGNKDQILIHCKDLHNDRSGLPCIFKCMKEIFTEFIFISPGNLNTWNFCGPCKKYSSMKINCNSSNHLNKKTKSFHCNSCLLNFMCSQDVYNKHLLSCEHIMLEHFRSGVNENPESLTTHKLKLPPIILNKFSINNKIAVCNDCKFHMLSTEKSITVHLTECVNTSDISGKNTIKINKYFCEVCNETTSNFGQWKSHLILSSHLIKCYDSTNLVSYTCKVCLLHCYGNAHHVAEHQAIHPDNSEKSLSAFMAFNFQRINENLCSNQFYFCEDCQTYDEVNVNSNHWNKSHKTKLKRMICQPCRTEFFCIEGNDLFLKHFISSEHIILKYITTKKPHIDLKSSSVDISTKLNVLNDQTLCSTTSTIDNLKIQKDFIIKPYLNWFKNIDDGNKASCISCNDLIDIHETALLCHLLNCDQNSTINKPMTDINSFRCLECVFHCNDYDSWEKHAISHLKLDTYRLYSYLHQNSFLLYGKINDIESHLKNDHKILINDLPLETILMTKQLMRRNNNNACKPPGIMCFCEPCKKIFKAIENCYHFNTDSHALLASDLVELFYCKYCDVEFYSSNLVYECHKLTAEHIIMRSEYSETDITTYLKPLKLDVHLLKFVTNQNLYDTTLNIGFFCFICNYLCLSLDVWKTHINSKKHNHSSKGVCMDHRCKICKTLMFGQRQHMFEHYRNPLHSMLRKFKSANTTGIKKNKFEIKHVGIIETISEDDQTVCDKNKLRESTSKINNTNTMTKMVDELTLESNNQQENNILKEAPIFINELHPMTNSKNNETYMKKEVDKSLESNIQLDESTSTINETQLNDNIKGNHENVNKLTSDIPSIVETDDQEKKNEKEANNRKTVIEIKDAKSKYKKNSWTELKKVFSFYGYFGIYPKHNSVIIMFRKPSSVQKMLKDKEKLEKMHEFSICVSYEEDKLPELKKITEFEFGNKELLLKNINAQLMAINQEISNPNILHRLQLLISAIHRCAGPHFMCGKTYAFGSRMSGLALKDSDVDLYFDIANTFGGELCNDLYAQEDLVRYFGKMFRSQINEFKHIQLITGARVPIVKFLHLPSNLYCDLSFKSGLSTHNTKLVRLYLTLDERVHWVVCAVVKRWALQNDLKNQGMFTSYALAWLVLFYLMTIDVVPPLKLLRENAKYSEDESRSDVMFIEDWDCTFCSLEKAKQIWKVPEIPCWDLLFGFFKFYSDSNRLKQFVFCPAIGEAIPKDKFVDIPKTNPDIFGFYKKKTGDNIQRCIKLRENFHNEGLAVQDPFDLFHNITKIIVPRKLQGFSHLCSKTLEVMKNGIQPYYA